MRIVIDLQGAQTGSRFRGIGRYTTSLVREMLKSNERHEIIVLLNGMFSETITEIRNDLSDLISQDNILVWDSFAPVPFVDPASDQRRAFAEYVREAFIANLRPDVLLVTSLFEGAGDNAVGTVRKLFDIPTAVILYDLIPYIYSDKYLTYDRIRQWYQDKIDNVRRASASLAISQSSAREAVKYLGLDSSTVVNISTASDGSFQKQPIGSVELEQLDNKFGVFRPFLLYVSAADDRKNQSTLIEAFALLPRSARREFQLVLAGAMESDRVENFRSLAEAAGLNGHQLIITGKIDDGELNLLYNACTAFAFPSWHEGFGLPALEAMHCGKAVIASNVSSLPEVVGLEEALFDPFDARDIAAKVEQVLLDESFRAKLERHAGEQIKKFSWAHSARTALDALSACAAKSYNEIKEVPFARTTKYVLDQLCGRLISERLVDVDDPIALSNMLARNLPDVRRRPQLFVDVSELSQHDNRSGIQRVVRSILNEWLEKGAPGWRIEPVYATLNEDGYRYASKFKARFLGIADDLVEDLPIEASPGDIFLGLDLQHYVLERQASSLEHLRSRGVQVGFVVYDLLPLSKSQHFLDWLGPMHEAWLKNVSSFDRAFCISKAVADELLDWLQEFGHARILPFGIDWFHLGADHTAAAPTLGVPEDADEVLRNISEKTTFLMVGTIEPRKGHAQVLDAFERLWKQKADVNIVIVGKQGWNVEALIERISSHGELGKRLLWLEGVSDEYLDKVYGACSCLLAASEGEGFGLPLIEAAQHKIAIIARDIPVFREVAGEHAAYFKDSRDAEVIVHAVKSWMSKFKAGKHARSDNISYLSWEESAKMLLDLALKKRATYVEWPSKAGSTETSNEPAETVIG